MTPAIVACIAGAVMLAGFVQGVVGFGFGLVAMALIPLLLGVKGAVPLVAVFGGVVNLSLAVRYRRDLDVRAALPLFVGCALGIPAGVWLLRSLDPSLLTLTLGLLVGGYVVNAARQGGAVRELGPRWGGALGLVSGVLGGAFSSGGPPAVVWVSSKPWSPAQLRATLVTDFVIIAAVQITLFTSNGMLTMEKVKVAAIALPAAGVGSWLGARTGDRVDPKKFKKIMLGALGVVALNFIVKGLSGL
jgi:uncharacterized protein